MQGLWKKLMSVVILLVITCQDLWREKRCLIFLFVFFLNETQPWGLYQEISTSRHTTKTRKISQPIIILYIKNNCQSKCLWKRCNMSRIVSQRHFFICPWWILLLSISMCNASTDSIIWFVLGQNGIRSLLILNA